MTLSTDTDVERWTMGISICSVCDKDRDPLEIPDEPCGHTYTFQKIVDVPVVPRKHHEAEVARLREALEEIHELYGGKRAGLIAWRALNTRSVD